MTGEENNGKKVTKGVYFRIEGTGGDPKLALEVDVTVEEFDVLMRNLSETLGGADKLNRLIGVLEATAETERVRASDKLAMEQAYRTQKELEQAEMTKAMAEMQKNAITTRVATDHFAQILEQIKQLDEFKKTLKSGGY